MASATVEEGLRRYGIGAKVRALRLRKKMPLVELGKHTGFSAALLSKIESSKIFPPLGTLLRIAMVFGVGLDHFFRDPGEKPALAVVRRKDRVRLPNDPKHPSYDFESLDFPANERRSSSYFAEFHEVRPEKAPVHAHPGAETIYVISGKLSITIGAEEHELAAGDSIYFDSSVPHSYRRIGGAECRAVVNTVV
ncbi:MAG TPA: cupin domain-containing protein [Thermoanaerobaculia bacterium]|nr:cupin domain-containing protein [Thermoanaerobaculia bacterium]